MLLTVSTSEDYASATTREKKSTTDTDIETAEIQIQLEVQIQIQLGVHKQILHTYTHSYYIVCAYEHAMCRCC